MKEMINEAILPMINSSMFSMDRINNLIEIKDFVDGIAGKMYLEAHDVDDLNNRYGVKPNIITWGDYFQTEMASSLIDLSDEEFGKAINTVKYDMISSHLIFSSKGSDFFEWIDNSYDNLMKTEKSDYSEDEEEILHLKILKEYYLDINIQDNFSAALMKWYESFREAVAI